MNGGSARKLALTTNAKRAYDQLLAFADTDCRVLDRLLGRG
jgi:hypothetical protein